GAPDLGRAIDRHAKLIGLERNQVSGIGAARMCDQRKSEHRRQTLRDIDPGIAAVVAAINAGMILQVDAIGIFRVVTHLVRALGTEMRRVRRTVVTHDDALIAPRPRLTAIVAAISAGRRNTNNHALRIMRIGQNRMQTESAESRHPVGPLGMVEQRVHWAKRLAAIVGAVERGGIDAREYHVATDQRGGLERPNRIQGESAAGRKLYVAIGGLGPTRAEIIRPTNKRAPMLTLVAD